jgi:hypothetical protein
LKDGHYYDDLNDLKRDCEESWDKYAIEEENEWKCVQYVFDVVNNRGYCYAWTGAGFVDTQDMNATVRADVAADTETWRQNDYANVDLNYDYYGAGYDADGTLR